MKKTKMIFSLVICLICVWFVQSAAYAATMKVVCNSKQTLGNALKKLKPGDTLLVSGTCNENVEVPAEMARITLDGQGKATIKGPDSSKPTLLISGRRITVKGFTITGGLQGIQVWGGGDAEIDGNTIEGVGRFGIQLARTSTALIVNNTIRNNTTNGITVGGSSYALIGVRSGRDTTTSPNTIEANGSHGISVSRASSARIAGNVIRNNKGHGVTISRASQADVSNSMIDDNGGNGIDVNQNSSVSLGVGTGSGIFDLPNSTASNNAGMGIRCAANSSVDGRLGSLNGAKGAKNVDGSCVDKVKEEGAI